MIRVCCKPMLLWTEHTLPCKGFPVPPDVMTRVCLQTNELGLVVTNVTLSLRNPHNLISSKDLNPVNRSHRLSVRLPATCGCCWPGSLCTDSGSELKQTCEEPHLLSVRATSDVRLLLASAPAVADTEHQSNMSQHVHAVNIDAPAVGARDKRLAAAAGQGDARQRRRRARAAGCFRRVRRRRGGAAAPRVLPGPAARQRPAPDGGPGGGAGFSWPQDVPGRCGLAMACRRIRVGAHITCS